MELSPNQDCPQKTIFFPETATLAAAGDVHAVLCDALREGAHVVASTRNIRDCDLTLVQLILSARASALAESKKFELDAPAEGVLLDQLERGGFLAAPQDQEFWLHKTR